MSDEQNAGGAAAPMTPEAATAQKTSLMADAAWRTAAMDPKGTAWAQMASLNQAIAAAHPDAEADDDEEAFAAPSPPAAAPPDDGDDEDDDDDPAALAAIHRVPERPGQYDLPQQRAEQLGLKVDPAREIELRQAFHAAEVPQSLAQAMYMAAISAALLPEERINGKPSRAEIEATEYLTSARTLHDKWGSQYDANLATANAEARLIFDKMPASLTNGVSFADWCRSSGIANSRVVVEALLSRAKARGSRGA